MNILLAESTSDNVHPSNTDCLSNGELCSCQSDQSDFVSQTDQSNACSGDRPYDNQSGCCRANQSNSKKLVAGMEKLSIFDKKAKPVIDF